MSVRQAGILASVADNPDSSPIASLEQTHKLNIFEKQTKWCHRQNVFLCDGRSSVARKVEDCRTQQRPLFSIYQQIGNMKTKDKRFLYCIWNGIIQHSCCMKSTYIMLTCVVCNWALVTSL